MDGGKTHVGSPMRDLIDRGAALEKDVANDVMIVSICSGFTAADIRDIGRYRVGIWLGLSGNSVPVAAVELYLLQCWLR